MADQVGVIVRIPIGLIDPGPNARGPVGDVTELAASIRAIGQQVPVIVAEVGDNRYRLVDGHRRYAAAKQAGRAHLDAIVRLADPIDARRVVGQIAIQLHTQRFAPMAEARALHQLMFVEGWTREEIAHAVGKSPAWVRDRISLVHLRDVEQAALDRGVISVAEALRRLRERREERDGREPSTSRAPGLSAFQAGVTAKAPYTAADRGRCPTCRQPLPGRVSP